MAILKKTLFAGLAAIAMASASTAAFTTSAEAGNYRYYNSHKHSYHCHYKKVWRWNSYGHRYLKKIKYCH